MFSKDGYRKGDTAFKRRGLQDTDTVWIKHYCEVCEKRTQKW